MYALFVCGAPHNKIGFELTILEGAKNIPRAVIGKIDKFDPEHMNKGSIFVIQTLYVDDSKHLLIVNYIGVTPSEQQNNRGAYIAAGALCESDTTASALVGHMAKIVALQYRMRFMRNENNAFSMRFDMRRDITYAPQESRHIAFLAQKSLKLVPEEKLKRLFFNSFQADADVAKESLSAQYIENEMLQRIQWYKQALEEEKAAHARSQKAYKEELKQLKQKLANAQEQVRRHMQPAHPTMPSSPVTTKRNRSLSHTARSDVGLHTKRRHSSKNTMYMPTESSDKNRLLFYGIIVLLFLVAVVAGVFAKEMWQASEKTAKTETVLYESDMESEEKYDDTIHPAKENIPDKNLTPPSSVSATKVSKIPPLPPKTLKTLEKLKEIEAISP